MQKPEPGSSGARQVPWDTRRIVLAVLTSMLALSLLTFAIWPGLAANPTGAVPASAPPAAQNPTPPASTPPVTPVPPGTAPPETPGIVEQPGGVPLPPLPPVPAAPPAPPPGELSLLLEHGDRACKQVALTYDGGSGADGAVAILDVLQRENVPATFFFTGKWVEAYPELAKRIVAAGYLIGNHTYDHQDLTKLAPQAATKEIADGEAAILRITGRDPKPFLREPYGAFDDAERRLVREAGYTYSVYWDVDSLDWQFPPLAELEQRLLSGIQNGSIVLMHLNVAESAQATAHMIPLLREKGYTFVSVQQVLRCPT